MRDKVIFGFSILWIIALSVTLTIFLAIPLFFGEIFLVSINRFSSNDCR